MPRSIGRIFAVTSVMIAVGGPAAAQAPQMKSPSAGDVRVAPIPQRVIDPCHGQSPAVCAQACGRDLHALTTSYNQRYQACVTRKSDEFNSAPVTRLHALCQQYGFSNLDQCLQNISAAIARSCENSSGPPTLAQVQAKAAQCRAEAPPATVPPERPKVR